MLVATTGVPGVVGEEVASAMTESCVVVEATETVGTGMVPGDGDVSTESIGVAGISGEGAAAAAKAMSGSGGERDVPAVEMTGGIGVEEMAAAAKVAANAGS
jgi:hypothetical protein